MKIKYFEDRTYLSNSHKVPYGPLAAWLWFILGLSLASSRQMEEASVNTIHPHLCTHPSGLPYRPSLGCRDSGERVVLEKEQNTRDFLPGHLLLASFLLVGDQEAVLCDFHWGFLWPTNWNMSALNAVNPCLALFRTEFLLTPMQQPSRTALVANTGTIFTDQNH